MMATPSKVAIFESDPVFSQQLTDRFIKAGIEVTDVRENVKAGLAYLGSLLPRSVEVVLVGNGFGEIDESTGQNMIARRFDTFFGDGQGKLHFQRLVNISTDGTLELAPGNEDTRPQARVYDRPFDRTPDQFDRSFDHLLEHIRDLTR